MDDSLACQRCHQPLLRDPSTASPSQADLIAGQLPAPAPPSSLPPAQKLKQQPPAARPAAAAWAGANPIAESYVFLPASPASPNTNTSTAAAAPGTAAPGGTAMKKRPSVSRSASATPSSSRASTPPPESGGGLRIAPNIDALLSARTNIDHPVCMECTGLFQKELQRELEDLTRERDGYIAFERTIRKRAEGSEGLIGDEAEWDALLQRKEELAAEEEALRKQLREKEDELAAVREEERRVKEEEEAIDQEESEFLRTHTALGTQLAHLNNTLRTAKTQLLLSSSLLEHLENTNVYNDAFQIGHAPLASEAGRSITVGTINGLRLGGRPNVDWDEINAAWGLVALCIDRLAAKVGYRFESYKIVPLGSSSRIDDLPPGKGQYELHASADLSPGRLLQNRRFNHALVALLDCLRQLLEFGRRTGRAWGEGNIEITKDKINGHPIRMPGLALPTISSMSIMGLGGSTEERSDSADEGWTRACRAVLAVLKRILVVESEDRD